MAVLDKILLDDDTVITPTAQVSTITLNNNFNDSETDITVTLTNEVGGTQTESIDPSGTAESTIAAALRSALNSSIQSLFTAITWTVSTNVVTGTAKTSGVPFIVASAVTGGTGTRTDATSNANVGPNDWNTTSIWSEGSKPANDDVVVINSGSRDIKYGLNQSAVNLKGLRIGKQYRGIIGDKVNQYHLQVTVSNTGGGNTPFVSINTGGVSVWLNGTMPTVIIRGCSVDADAVQLKGDVDDLRLIGPDVKGTITCADSMTLDRVFVLGVGGARLILGKTLSSFDLLQMDSGIVENNGALAASGTFDIAGGKLIHLKGSVANVNVRGGELDYRGDGTLTTLHVYNGLFSLVNSVAKTLIISNAGTPAFPQVTLKEEGAS
ncbi:MAG: hypothetical protein IIB38_01095 [Candidatus Hydrogenedentes bacterium]|nr:hypothetical protein [Candidatus Hydrogenedentota bacterium]